MVNKLIFVLVLVINLIACRPLFFSYFFVVLLERFVILGVHFLIYDHLH